MYLLTYMYTYDKIINWRYFEIHRPNHKKAERLLIAEEVNEDSVPVIATNKDSLDDVVILGKADYDSLMETLHVYGVPGMAEKLDRAEKEEGIPFTSLEDIPDV